MSSCEALLSAWLDLALMTAPWLLLGLGLAVILHVFVQASQVANWLGQGRSLGAVVRGALVGIPLPLCSCAILPVVAGLRRQGAARGAVVSFLYSAPQTGPDALILTVMGMGWMAAGARAALALLAAVGAGFAVERLGGSELTAPSPAPDCACGCGPETKADAAPASSLGFFQRFGEAMIWAGGTLLAEQWLWMALGLFLSALVGVLGANQAWVLGLGASWLAYPLILLLAIPSYTCAASSTPFAAALMLAGLRPGAVLVFLLVGPATNLTTLAILRQTVGNRSAWVATATWMALALLLGLGIDALVAATGWTLPHSGATLAECCGGRTLPQWISLGVLVLWVVGGWGMGRWKMRHSG